MTEQEFATEKIISYFFGLVTKVAEKYDLDLVFFQDITSFSGTDVRDITGEIIKLANKK